MTFLIGFLSLTLLVTLNPKNNTYLQWSYHDWSKITVFCFLQEIRKWQAIFVRFLMTTDWNASSISCGKTWNFKWERMPPFRCQSRVFWKATFKKYWSPLELPDSKYSSLYSFDDDLNLNGWWYNMDLRVSFSFPLCGEPKFYYHFNEKTFFLELNETQLVFFPLSLYRWTLMALGRQVVWKLNENSGKIQQKQASMIKKDRKNCKTFPNNFYLLDRTTNRLNWHLSHCEHFVSYVSVTFILIFKVVSCIFNFFLFLHIYNKI